MKERDVERKLQVALEHAVPDVKSQIMARCEDGHKSENSVIPMNLQVKKRRRPIIANIVAAAAVILLVFQFGYYQSRSLSEGKVETVIDLDVNPSIELSINSKDRVVEAKAVNLDAKIVLEDMELEGTQTKVAVNAIVGAMLSKGYLSENANSILISVDNQDQTKSIQIQEQLVENIDTMLQACSVDAAILSQSVQKDDAVTKQAENYNISAGRMALINKIIEMNSAYSIEDLAYLTVNELNMIISAGNIAPVNVSSKGTVNEAAYIGLNRAITIVLEDQNLAMEMAGDIATDVAILNSRMVYCISFIVDEMQYDYKIDALDGSIASCEEHTPEIGEVDTDSSEQDEISVDSDGVVSVSDNHVSENMINEADTEDGQEEDADLLDENESGENIDGDADETDSPDENITDNQEGSNSDNKDADKTEGNNNGNNDGKDDVDNDENEEFEELPKPIEKNSKNE